MGWKRARSLRLREHDDFNLLAPKGRKKKAGANINNIYKTGLGQGFGILDCRKRRDTERWRGGEASYQIPDARFRIPDARSWVPDSGYRLMLFVLE